MVQIETARMVIRDYCEGDIIDFHRLFTNDEVMLLMPEVQTSSWDESRKFLYESIVESKFDNRQKFFFAMTEKNTGAFLGEIGFSTVLQCEEGRVVNLGYFIFPEYWGKGLVTEAVKSLMQYAFEKLDVIKVEVGCLKDNIGSVRVAQKAGMILEGELLKHMYYNGRLHDRLDFRMMRDEWLILQQK